MATLSSGQLTLADWAKRQDPDGRLATVAELGKRGVEFVQSRGVQTEGRGALTKTWLGGVSFELVHDDRG